MVPEKKETIEQYAKRILVQIKDECPILIGLSFGGMMAIEVAKLINCKQVILISSAKTKQEIPRYYRQAGTFLLHRLLPLWALQSANRLTYWMFGAETEIERNILKNILDDTDPAFLKWAIDKIVRWNNTTVPECITHIHGNTDRILPLKFVHADIVITDGGHFMVLNKADQISKLFHVLVD